MAVEAVDRAMRGQTSPTPIYEGEDGVIAWLLDGKEARYEVPLPERGEATPRHPRQLHQGALGRVPGAGLDRPGPQARQRAPRAARPGERQGVVLHTSHHTHHVIGSGANDPQKYDPTASRETLDHSIPHIFVVALQDGAWDHEASYAPARAGRPDTVELWRKVTTAEDEEWTRRYHSLDPTEQAFGGRVEFELADGTAEWSTRSPSPTRTRSAPARSPASSTSASSDPRGRRARRWRRPSGSSTWPSGCPSSRPTSSAGLFTVRGGFPAVAPPGIF